MLWAWWAWGCTEPPETEQTDDPIPLEPLFDASCALSEDNSLRATCRVAVVPPAGVEIAFAPEDDHLPERVHRSEQIGTDHTIPLFLMSADTRYRWSARPIGEPEAATGVLRTGFLPQGTQVQFGLTQGTPTFPLVGFSSPCIEGASVIIADTRGEVLWYQRLVPGRNGQLDGLHFTDEHTVLAVIDGGIRELDLSGRVLLDVPSRDLPSGVTHHDVLRRGDHTWALYKQVLTEGDQSWRLDGFYVLDRAGQVVFDWWLADYHQPMTFEAEPDQIDDYSHANSLWVDDAGDVTLSLRHLSALVRIAGLDRPDAGTIDWVLDGDGPSELGQDFTIINLTGGLDGFARQHNVHQLPDGRWAMFDNRAATTESSRLLVLDIDEDAHQAILREAYDLDTHCPYQGGALYTAGGNPVATCAPARVAMEYDAGTAGPDPAPEAYRWSMQVDCTGLGPRYVPRFAPLDW